MAKKRGNQNKSGGLNGRKLTPKQLKNKERSQKKMDTNLTSFVLLRDASDDEYIRKNGNSYVFAMYDVRGKQKFIFKSSHLKEIVGGSAIIRDIFEDYFYTSVEKVGQKRKPNLSSGKFIYRYDLEDGKKELPGLTKESFEEHLKEGAIAELFYNGGGNFFVLFENIDVFRDVTYEFTKEILKNIGTIHVLATGIEGLNFSDYNEDRRRLYERHARYEVKKNISRPWGTLPIVQVDYDSSMPLVAKENIPELTKVTKESSMKYKKYSDMDDTDFRSKEGEEYLYKLITKKEEEHIDRLVTKEGEKILDKLVTKKGEESLLAVIYIDGNGMGAKVEKKTQGLKTYEDCSKALRDFSKEIQKNYIDDPIYAIDQELDNIHSNDKNYVSGQRRRLVIYAGDEINFICNARDALALVRAYMSSLKKGESACAGIAIFHSHAPYADAYQIAEQCCESGKAKMKEGLLGEEIRNACFVDTHYCHGAIATSLESIREREVGDLCSKPWLISIDEAEKEKLNNQSIMTMKEVDKAAAILNKLGRSNVKGLAESARRSVTEYCLELRRIKAHMSKEKREGIDFSFMEKHRDLVYDTVLLFDIWFANDDSSETDEQEEVV